MSEQATNAAPTSAPAESPSAPQNDNGAPVTEPAAPAEPTYKLKIKGEEKEFPLSKVLELAQKGEGADQRFREAAKLEQEIDAVLRRLPEDPIGILEKLTGDKSRASRTIMDRLWADPATRANLEAYMLEQYEYAGLPDDQRKHVDEVRELRGKAERLEALEAEKKQADEQRRQQDLHARAAEMEQRFIASFTPALEAVGVPVTEHSMARMAALAEAAIDGKQRTTVAKLAERVRDEVRAEVAKLVGVLEPEQLAELLGDAPIGKLRAWDAKRLKGASASIQRAGPSNDNGAAPEKPRPKRTASEIMAEIRKRGGG
jgi:hypothetical protein